MNSFPTKVQKLLEQVRVTIKQYEPDAEESVSYGMPAYKLYDRPLLYFAA